nr:hypothetical protein [Tanacetum cinerariifolium]
MSHRGDLPDGEALLRDVNMKDSASQPYVVQVRDSEVKDDENVNIVGLKNAPKSSSLKDSVNSDLLPTDGNGDAIVFNIVPNVLNIAEIFGDPFKTFVDIKDLMNEIEMGKHEAVWSGMTEERRKDVMDSVFTTLKRLTEENPSVASNVGNTVMDTINEDTLHVDDSPIVTIQDKPRSYVGVAGGSKLEPRKFKANFRLLSLENLYEGANFSIP